MMILYKEILGEVSMEDIREPMPLVLQGVDTPSLEAAENFAGNGKWEEAANHYFSLGMNIDVAQQLINLGRMSQAEDFLKKAEMAAFAKAEDDQTRIQDQARIAGKRGWIDDNFGRFEESLSHFTEAQDLVSRIPSDHQGQVERDILSNARHFIGRAHVGIANQGNDAPEHIKLARELFETDLSDQLAQKDNRIAQTINAGFQHTWLARCDMVSKDFVSAEKHLEDARALFEKYREGFPESGIMATYFSLKGFLDLRQNNPSNARAEFTKALEIRRTVEQYPRGEAQIVMGLAACSWVEGDKDEAQRLGQEAIAISPEIVYFQGI